MSTADHKRDIAARNKTLEKKGATSRYIDSAPQEDWTLSDDEQMADRDANPMADIPQQDIDAAQGQKERVLAEMKQRGLLSSDYHVPGESIKQTRREAVVRMLAQQRALGFGWEDLQAELEEIDAQQ